MARKKDIRPKDQITPEQDKQNTQNFILDIVGAIDLTKNKVLQTSAKAIISDKQGGRLSRAGFVIGGFAVGVLLARYGAPAILGMTGVPPVVATALTFIQNQGFLAAFAGAALGVPAWIGYRALKKSVKRRREDPEFIKRYRQMKKKAGHLQSKNLFKVNCEDHDMIVRNGCLVVLHDDTLKSIQKDGGFLIPEGVETLSPNLFNGLKGRDQGMSFLIPSTMKELDFSVFPSNSRLVFKDMETKAALCRNLEFKGGKKNPRLHYDPKTKKSISIEGETFQSHVYSLKTGEVLPETRTTWYVRGTDSHSLEKFEDAEKTRAGMARLSGLDLARQKKILDMIQDMVKEGEATVQEFRYIFSQSAMHLDQRRMSEYTSNISIPQTDGDYDRYYETKIRIEKENDPEKAFMGAAKKICSLIDMEIKNEIDERKITILNRVDELSTDKQKDAYRKMVIETLEFGKDNQELLENWVDYHRLKEIKRIQDKVEGKGPLTLAIAGMNKDWQEKHGRSMVLDTVAPLKIKTPGPEMGRMIVTQSDPVVGQGEVIATESKNDFRWSRLSNAQAALSNSLNPRRDQGR